MTETSPAHVLFVDDQPEVLAGLRTSLHRERRHFVSHFAGDVAEARRLLAVEPIEVVVTDLQMPSTNGIEMLRLTAAEHPDVVRYVLTGDSTNMIMEALPWAHRCLTKPCSREQILGALHEAVRFRQLIADPEVTRAVTRLGSLPSSPALYTRIMETCADDHSSSDDVADLISDDTALTAKILQWGNSAFGGAGRVHSVADAITRVGLRTLAQLVVSLEMEGAFETAPTLPGTDDLATVDLARSIGRRSSMFAAPASRTTARVAGVLSIAGLLLEAQSFPDRLVEDHARALAEKRPLVEVERARHGVSHAEICGHLLAVWGLPADVATAASSAWYTPVLDGSSRHDLTTAVQLGRISTIADLTSTAHGDLALSDDVMAALATVAGTAVEPGAEAA